MKVLGLLLIGLMSCLVSCTLPGAKPVDNRYAQAANPPLVDDKYRLSADREKFDELRKQIPESIKAANDEEALILHLTSEVKRPPEEIRRTFDQKVRRKREEFDRDMKKERQNFQTENRSKRDKFLKTQSTERAAFTKAKRSSSERSEFFKNQDLKRKNFFADERERENDFESQNREKRKNFEDYMRTETNRFTAEMREYSKKYEDLKKSQKEAGK